MKTTDRFELFLEKATELGVNEIIPMISERTVSRPKENKHDSKQERWEKIILSACKQSQRYWIPKLSSIQSFSEMLTYNADLKLIPYERSELNPHVSFSGKRILFAIGGEGGFTENEIELAKAHHFVEISLGKSILRAETAGIFALSMVRAQLINSLAK